MKYYRQIKVVLIVAFITLVCLWLYGCASSTETDFPIKTPFLKV